MRNYIQFGVPSDVAQYIYNLSNLFEYVDNQNTRSSKIREFESSLKDLGFPIKKEYFAEDAIFSGTNVIEESTQAACDLIQKIDLFYLSIMMMGMCREIATPANSVSDKEKAFLKRLDELLNKNDDFGKKTSMNIVTKLFGIFTKKDNKE